MHDFCNTLPCDECKELDRQSLAVVCAWCDEYTVFSNNEELEVHLDQHFSYLDD